VALAQGSRLGVYEILTLIGQGGMGEVYRARDSKLNRDVAIKVLPADVAADRDRLARFEREAQTLAALNHPNIAHLHGVEEALGTPALVMELVEGPTLADRIVEGPIQIDEALPIAKQIAEALEAAHEQGIIHRDLKPANIKVRPDGAVKVLDFGLAKAFEPAGVLSANATTSPTLSLHATQAGVILGTAAYMSPEQAKGKPVDRRADLWSFGCVLFEMLTGRQPFVGETTSDVLAKVIERDPQWSALPATTPASIRTLLRRCFEKDPRRRLDSAAVARMEIDDVSRPTPLEEHAAGIDVRAARWRWPSWAALALAAAAAGVAVIATWAATRRPAASPSPLARFSITLPAAQPLAFSINDCDIAIASDGTHLAYTAGDQAQLMVRSLDQLEAVPLAGITNARSPFFSPEGGWIGYFDRLDEGLTTGPGGQRGSLKKVRTSGGPPITIASVTGGSRGATWATDGSIIFATNDVSTGLLRVSADGGEPQILTKLDTANGERDHYFPSLLPDGHGVLFTIDRGGGDGGISNRQVAVLDLKTGARKTVIRGGGQAEYVETGHLVYANGGALWAVRFDPASLTVSGESVPILEHVLTLGAAGFAVSSRGTLLYVPAGGRTPRSLVWVTRRGVEEPIPAPPHIYSEPRLSPEGKRVALNIAEPRSQIWIWDIVREALTRLTFGNYESFWPAWTPDGRYLVFGSVLDGAANLQRRAADGSGAEERLLTSPRQQRVNAISPDGTRLVFEEHKPSADYDFMLLHLDGTKRVEPLLQTPFDERNAAISPNGRWMAYESNETGQSQVYVRPFPNVADGRYQVSIAGGRTPLWSPDGRELFFVNRTTVLTARVQSTSSFAAGTPTILFDNPSILVDGRLIESGTNRMFDVSPDGQRFLMIKQSGADGTFAPASIVVVQHWVEELKRLVPTK
jgi:serine/threonine-protein kinase